MKDTTYNGHKNWDYWNVSLWINNDEALYQQAKFYRSITLNAQKAASAMLDWLKEMDMEMTPDGAKYTVLSIHAAIKDIEK